MKAQKNTKGKALGGPNREVLYETFGLYTHGGVYGITTKTKSDEDLVRYLNRIGRHLLPEGASWSSITVIKGCSAEPHHDFNNQRGSENFVFTTGGRDPGLVWIEEKELTEGQAHADDVKWKNINGRGWVPGRLHRSHNNVIHFDPFLKHATLDWDEDKWCAVFHTTKSMREISPELAKYLKNLEFKLPRPVPASRGSSGTMPRKSTRRTIFSNAAKLGVMLTSLALATDSFLGRGVYSDKVHSPIVMFEIGGVGGTEEAVKLDKDVFEPMTWERYGTCEGKEAAYHIVNGGYPRELRINLYGKSGGDDEALCDLIGHQINSGGSAVIVGDKDDSLFGQLGRGDVDDSCRQFHREDEGKITVVYYKAKVGGRCVVGAERAHDVFVVDGGHDFSAIGGRGNPGGVYPVDGSAIKFDASTPPEIATSLRRMDQNLGHPRREELLRHLRLAGCGEEVLKAVRSMTCEVCAATGGPKSQRPSALPHMLDFGELLGVDIFYAHDANDVKHTFLSIADYGTTFHQVVRVDGQSAGDIEDAFNTLWIVPYGAPKSIAVDLDGGLQAGLARLCDWHGIDIRSVAAQGHWQAGIVERQQAWWKNVWERIVHELTITEDEVDIAVPIVSAAKNDLRRRCGYSPSQWVFGRGPRLPEELRDPDSGERVSWDVSAEARFQRQSVIRASARVAFHNSQLDSRLRKALLQRARTTSRKLDVGETVHFWHQRKDRRRGQWEGPGIIVGTEGGNYWISKGGRCRLKAPEHVRPSSPEEVGEYFVMKGTKREIEKLLEGDPDDPATFDDGGEELEDEEHEGMDLDGDEDDGYGVGEIELGPDPEDEETGEIASGPPRRRLKRKMRPDELPGDSYEAMMLKTDLTRRGVEKRKEKELRWNEIPDDMKDDFRSAEVTQWQEHLSFDALAPLTSEQSAEVRRTSPLEMQIPVGYSRTYANGLKESDPWHMAAGDIRCAFLTGSYLTRELYIHQPATGFPDMNPGDLVRVKKNVFGLATSPHEWWLDLQDGIYATKVTVGGKDYYFEQCDLDPCIFMLREYLDGKFVGRPLAFIGCHVDDILIAAPESFMKAMQAGLSATFPIETWEDDEFEFLGSHFSIVDNEVHINQSRYASTRLFSLDIPKGAQDDEPAPQELVADNRSLIGALSWMSAQSRPDLTCSVSMAQQLQQSPCYGDIRFTNSVAAKARDYKEHGLRFKAIDGDRLMIICYHDAAWANVPEPDPEETYYQLTAEDNEAGLQREAPDSYKRSGRKAKKGTSKVASQLGCLVLFADRGSISGQPGVFSIADWKSRAGQRVCRSTFGAETQACVEGLETGQYMRSLYETLTNGEFTGVNEAITPVLCLSDCRSLFDHLTKQGVPRVPSDKRLAVDLAALRQSLKSERINGHLPIAWVPGETQLGDILTKPQNPASWWERLQESLLIPIGIAEQGSLISNRAGRSGTSVKPEVFVNHDNVFPYEYCFEKWPDLSKPC
ncbi:RE2 [Symbiodinium sp. CCMP2456]|nr:RE2 [Symbiodinium sp. CCMP2456]